MPRAVMLVLALALGCRQRPRDVVLVTIDTLRADRLGAYGYPHDTSPAIDALAADATLFEHAVPTCPATAPSMASLMTGLHRARHGVMRNGGKLTPSVRTLAALLAAQGYRTVARVANPILSAGNGFAKGFDDFVIPPDLPRTGPAMFEGSALVREAEHVLAVPSEKPLFLWIHFMDPHGPYAPAETCAGAANVDDYRWPDDRDLPVGDSDYGLDRIPRYQAVGDDRSPASYRARYDGEIRCVDRHVAAIVRLLHDRGLWDRALVVLAADHGESLGEHHYFFQHGAGVYEDSVRVPLLIRAPGLAPTGRRVAQTVSLVDVAPTVLDLLGLPTPPMEGGTLRPLLEASGPDRPAFSQTWYGNGLVTLRLGPSKYIVTRGVPSPRRGERTPPAREELYDLASDPQELHDLAAVDPARLERMRGAVDTWLATQGGGAATPAHAPRPGVEPELRALGYIE